MLSEGRRVGLGEVMSPIAQLYGGESEDSLCVTKHENDALGINIFPPMGTAPDWIGSSGHRERAQSPP